MTLIGVLAELADAQTRPVTPDRPVFVQTVSVVRQAGTFAYQGSDSPIASIDWSAPLYGLTATFASPREFSSFAFFRGAAADNGSGQVPRAIILEVQGGAEGRRLAGAGEFHARLAWPFMMGYRRHDVLQIDPDTTASTPEVRFGYGAGGAALLMHGRRGRWASDARAQALVGVTFAHQQQDAISRWLMLAWRAGLDVHARRLWRDLGLSAGIAVDRRSWKIPARRLFPAGQHNTVPYRSTEWQIRIGTAW